MTGVLTGARTGASTAFYKLSGSGNDFLALVEPEREPTPEEIRSWCARGLSLGADGLFVLRRQPPGARMTYSNADGRRAALCVNGTRCAARLAFELDWASTEIVVETDAGPIPARLSGDRVALALAEPARPERLEVEAGGRRIEGWRVSIGVPHFVLPWPETLAKAPVAELGPVLRAHAAFGEAGANVDFVRFPGRARIEIRTFERGVETETLACGSGVLAAAATGMALGRLELPATALTAGGFELGIERAAGTAPTRWLLAGDARMVAEGSLLAGASGAPPPAVWSRSP